MAHSLTNAKSEQFIGRTGSYSTHGSRRGFVDVPAEIPECQLNDYAEQVRLAGARRSELQWRADEIGRALSPGKTIKWNKIIGLYEAGKLRGAMGRLAAEAVEARREADELLAEIRGLQLKAKAWNIAQANAKASTSADRFRKVARDLLSEEEYKQIWAAVKARYPDE